MDADLVRPARLYLVLLAVFAPPACGLAGCAPKPGYSTPTVVSPLDRRGECFACKKPIEIVKPEHLFSGRGVQCVVCDAACARKAAEMMGVEYQPQAQ